MATADARARVEHGCPTCGTEPERNAKGQPDAEWCHPWGHRCPHGEICPAGVGQSMCAECRDERGHLVKLPAQVITREQLAARRAGASIPLPLAPIMRAEPAEPAAESASLDAPANISRRPRAPRTDASPLAGPATREKPSRRHPPAAGTGRYSPRVGDAQKGTAMEANPRKCVICSKSFVPKGRPDIARFCPDHDQVERARWRREHEGAGAKNGNGGGA